jgi:Rod binding domain-containing protein
MMMMSSPVETTLTTTAGITKPSAVVQRLTTKQTRALYENPQTEAQKKLKKVAGEFEGVFVQQLIEAMDKTVDREDSMMGGGEAEKTFRGMLNQQLATNITQAPSGGGFGMAQSVFEQSVQLLEEPTTPTTAQTVTPSNQTEKAFGLPIAQKPLPFSVAPVLKPFQQVYGQQAFKLAPLNPTLNAF